MTLLHLTAAIGRPCIVDGKDGGVRGKIVDAKTSYGMDRFAVEREVVSYVKSVHTPEVLTAMVWMDAYRVFVEVDGQLYPATSQAVMASRTPKEG